MCYHNRRENRSLILYFYDFFFLDHDNKNDGWAKIGIRDSLVKKGIWNIKHTHFFLRSFPTCSDEKNDISSPNDHLNFIPFLKNVVDRSLFFSKKRENP